MCSVVMPSPVLTALLTNSYSDFASVPTVPIQALQALTFLSTMLVMRAVSGRAVSNIFSFTDRSAQIDSILQEGNRK